MSFNQRKNILFGNVQKLISSIVGIFVLLGSKSIKFVSHMLKVINHFWKYVILFSLGLLIIMFFHSLLQAIAQVIISYQYSFINPNITSKEALTIATSVITILISTCAVIGVALLNMNQNRDYSIKKKDAIYTVYDNIWQLLANTRYFSRPYMSSKDAVTLYDDFTCKIMGAGTYKLKKKWLSMEQVFEKFFSSQETLDDTEKNNFYDCIALMERQISGFTSSSLRKTIVEKFLK